MAHYQPPQIGKQCGQHLNIMISARWRHDGSDDARGVCVTGKGCMRSSEHGGLAVFPSTRCCTPAPLICAASALGLYQCIGTVL